MNLIQEYEAGEIARLTALRAVPEFAPGDTLRVSVNIKEGERSRVQAFEGVCIARSNKGLNSNFTVRKISYGEGVERVFPLYAPTIAAIDVVRRGDVRRAKLYYLRGRRGKSARIAEKARDTRVDGDRRRRVDRHKTALSPGRGLWVRGLTLPTSRVPASSPRRSPKESRRRKGEGVCRARCSTKSGTPTSSTAWRTAPASSTSTATSSTRSPARRRSRAFASPAAASAAPTHTIAVVDHNVATEDRRSGIKEEDSRIQVETLEANVAEFGVPYIPLLDARQGIVHIIGPELGISLPGTTIVCGDSHTSTHGAMGALAFGIGTSEVEHVLATQTLLQKPAKQHAGPRRGHARRGRHRQGRDARHHRPDRHRRRQRSRDRIRRARHPRAGHGRPHDGLQHDHRGRRPRRHDRTRRHHVRLRPHPPPGPQGRSAGPGDRATGAPSRPTKAPTTTASSSWTPPAIAPMVSWGTNPEAVLPITGTVPDPASYADAAQADQVRRMLAYMDLQPGQKLAELPVDVVFIGSCTNGRIEDMRAAAAVLQGRHVAPGVRAMVVPGSGLVKQQAEQEGLDRLFLDAGFEWREAGCSMCLGMNPDKLTAGQRCASTSNRNFEGRQGPGGRTHLLSPAMAAAAAITGRLADVREFA